LTSAQFFAQRLRQVIGRPQTEQGLLGSVALLPRKDVLGDAFDIGDWISSDFRRG
jgi:hypothetical protein